MPTTTLPLTPATHGLRVAASFNVLYGPIDGVEQGRYSIRPQADFPQAHQALLKASDVQQWAKNGLHYANSWRFGISEYSVNGILRFVHGP
jgi:pyocin large subunit-like protein